MAGERSSSALITGTTSGVGRALLAHYARAGATIIAVNRRRVPELEAQYPAVRFECVDVRSAQGVARVVQDLAHAAELPDTWILNAGINRIDNDEQFELESYKDVLETNLYGVLNFVEPLTRLPATGAARHVVAISSMANYVGNPYGLGYHTSKKALTASFEVLSKMYTHTDLIFQQVLLGPVDTGIFTMSGALPAWMGRIKDAFAASPDAAAEAIARFASTRQPRLFYPWQAVPLYVGMWVGQSLIPGFFQGRKTLKGNARRVVPKATERAEPEVGRE